MAERDCMTVGIIDADLLDGCGHMPNLALMQIAGRLKELGIPYRLVTSADEDLAGYKRVYLSRVFSFTRMPKCYAEAGAEVKERVVVGGTGNYALAAGAAFRAARMADMSCLEQDELLDPYCPKEVMPDYHLYDEYVQAKLAGGASRQKFSYFLDYSIGFLTRGCVRHCPFCVNRYYDRVVEWSELDSFYDRKRPYVCFLDDNFLAAPEIVWKPILLRLIRDKVRFQFRQGLDIRLLTGTMAYLLKRTRYHGDMIFAFDRWADRDEVESRLRLWRKYCPRKSTKLYLFCGFRQKEDQLGRFLRDIQELFWRIKVLMRHRCLGYVMRHEDYKKAPIPNFYVQVARWVNQPAMFKKMSFAEFLHLRGDDCKGVQTMQAVLRMFPENQWQLEEFFYDTKWENYNG